MTVIMINPNSTAAMTESALAAARKAAPDIKFEGWTSIFGPPAIEGRQDGERAVPPLLELVKQASDNGASVIIIACFDDTGLDEARNIAACPVMGIGEASYIFASLLPGTTAVITTVAAAIPVIQDNVRSQGHSDRITRIIAANTPVLTLETAPEQAADHFALATERLDGNFAKIILGCAGAVTIAEILTDRLPFKFIEGVTSAARLCRVFDGMQSD